MIVVPSVMNTSSTVGNAAGSIAKSNVVNLQFWTGLDVRRRATQQDMYAAVVLTGQQQVQQRATDQSGGTGEQGSARGCRCVVHATTLPAPLKARNWLGNALSHSQPIVSASLRP